MIQRCSRSSSSGSGKIFLKCYRDSIIYFRCGVVSIPREINRDLVKLSAENLGLEELVKEMSEKDEDSENAVGSEEEKKSMTDWLRLNVGGTMFETSRSTLTSDSDSILSRMFEPNSNLPPATVTKDGVYLIDACPRGFQVVLNYLRYRKLILGECRMEDVFPVADYFGLGELRELLAANKESEENKEARWQNCVEGCTDRIEEVLQNIESEFTSLNEKMEDVKMEVSNIRLSLNAKYQFVFH